MEYLWKNLNVERLNHPHCFKKGFIVPAHLPCSCGPATNDERLNQWRQTLVGLPANYAPPCRAKGRVAEPVWLGCEISCGMNQSQIFFTDQNRQTRFYPEKSATPLALKTYKTELKRVLVMNKCDEISIHGSFSNGS